MNDVAKTEEKSISARTPERIAEEIRAYSANLLNSAVEIGRRFREAKELLPHGDFAEFVKEKCGYSVSTAENFMRLFDAYADDQISLFGATAKSQTFGTLSYSKAIALLAVPAEEREEFVAENDVESMSVRELREAIKAREEAEAKLAAVEKDLEAYEGIEQEHREEIGKWKAENRDLLGEIDKLRGEIADIKAEPIPVTMTESDPEAIEKAVAEALEAAKEEHRKELDALNGKLESANSAVERAKKKAADAEVKAKAYEEIAKTEADKASASALAEAAKFKEECDELRRQLSMSDPVVSEFKALFEQCAGLVSKLLALADAAPEDKRPNLRAALAALGKKAGGEE